MEPSTGARPVWPGTLVLAITAAAFAVAATFVMFSAFMYYDDEGYVLLSLRNFAEYGGLYRDIYSQYGPFPFVFYGALQAIGLPLTHNVGRLITIGAWAGTALACAALVGYATRSLVARLAVLAGVFVYLWVMASEPTHPGGLIVLLTALLAAFGYKWIATERFSPWAIVVGAATAVLLLTKINIGVFAAFSAGSWWLLHHRNDAFRRWAPGVVGAGAVLLPLALMRPLLGTPWVQDYAIVFACSGVALAVVTACNASGRTGSRELRLGLIAAGGVTIVVLGVIFLRGTSPRELIDGVLLGPLRHPASFSLRFLWPAGIRVIALISLVAMGVACLLRRRHVKGVDVVVAVLRLVLAAAVALNFTRYPIVSPDYLTFGCALPCLWLFVWPLAGGTSSHPSARAWLALLLLGQSLHAFPVPGSQIAWGSVLTLPLAAVGAWDAAVWLTHRKPAGTFALRPMILAGRVVMIGLVAVIGWKFYRVADRYRDGQNLGLPGAETIRLPDPSAALFRVLTMNAVAHADVLFSLPGMFSLNLWTDLPTPTHANVTHWFSLLDTPRQQAIIAALKAAPRACVIIDRGHVEFLNNHGLAPRGLLFDYIAQNFEAAFTIDRFEFCVHRGRHVEPFLLGEMLVRSTATDTTSSESALLKFSMLVPPSRAISTMELTAETGDLRPIVLNATNARAEVTPVTPRGEPSAPAHAVTWPIHLSGPGIVSVYFARERHPPAARGATLILRDAAGTEIGLARVRP